MFGESFGIDAVLAVKLSVIFAFFGGRFLAAMLLKVSRSLHRQTSRSVDHSGF
jgi:hypothetical protein